MTPWTAAPQASLSITNSELAQTLIHRVGDAIQPSHPPPPLSPPAFNLSQYRSPGFSRAGQLAVSCTDAGSQPWGLAKNKEKMPGHVSCSLEPLTPARLPSLSLPRSRLCPTRPHTSPVCLRCLCEVLVSQLSLSLCFVTLWTIACQAPLSMEFYRQEYWSG